MNQTSPLQQSDLEKVLQLLVSLDALDARLAGEFESVSKLLYVDSTLSYVVLGLVTFLTLFLATPPLIREKALEATRRCTGGRNAR